MASRTRSAFDTVDQIDNNLRNGHGLSSHSIHENGSAKPYTNGYIKNGTHHHVQVFISSRLHLAYPLVPYAHLSVKHENTYSKNPHIFVIVTPKRLDRCGMNMTYISNGMNKTTTNFQFFRQMGQSQTDI